MSCRAYKIEDINKEPSFNLTKDIELINFFVLEGESIPPEIVRRGGLVSLQVKTIKLALAEYQWESEDYRREQLADDIARKDDSDFINYYCI